MVKITSDSVADLENLFVEEQIDVMPLSVTLDGMDYLDGVSIKPQDIFRSYDERKVLPKTAARSADAYKEFFDKNNSDEGVVHFSLSSELSASYDNASLAAKQCKNVYVINSKSLSTGIGLLVLRARDMAKEGKTAEEIYRAVSELVPHIQASFVVDTMEYLHKGGRCSGIARFFAAALKIKPTILLTDGKMTVGKKYLGGFSKNIVRYVEDTLERYNTPDFRRIFITHTYSAKEDVEAVKAKIKEIEPRFEEIIETRAGCTITAHCGKNTLGILYINKEN